MLWHTNLQLCFLTSVLTRETVEGLDRQQVLTPSSDLSISLAAIRQVYWHLGLSVPIEFDVCRNRVDGISVHSTCGTSAMVGQRFLLLLAAKQLSR